MTVSNSIFPTAESITNQEATTEQSAVAVAEPPVPVAAPPVAQASVETPVQEAIVSTELTEDIDIDSIDQQIEEELKVNFKLAIESDLLKNLVNKVERAVAKKTVLETYKYIYMNVTPEKITFRAMNGDYTTEAYAVVNETKTNFKIKKGEGGSFCFPGTEFVAIVKKISTASTEITINDKKATIKFNAKFNLNGLEGSRFPAAPSTGDEVNSLTLPAHALSTLYDRTSYAVHTKESRPVLTGIHHKTDGKIFKCMATDSHRVAHYSYELDEEAGEIAATVPGDIAREVKKHLDSSEGNVTLHFFNHKIVYVFEDVIMHARLIDGVYPDISRLIFPSGNAGSSFVVQASAFKALLEYASVYDLTEPIILKVKPEFNEIRISLTQTEIGAYEGDISSTQGKGNDIAMAVNANYLIAALQKYAPNDYVQFEFSPGSDNQPSGVRPFKTRLLSTGDENIELYVPIRSKNIVYSDPVVIENFKGQPEFDFNAFESDFANIES